MTVHLGRFDWWARAGTYRGRTSACAKRGQGNWTWQAEGQTSW